MAWVSTVVGGLGVAAQLFGASESRSAGKQAKRLGKENAKFIGDESEEEKRRLRMQQEQTRGTAKLNIAASGFRSGKDSMGGSRKNYLKNLAEVQKSEIDWINKSTKSRQKIAKMGGNMEGKRLQATSYGQAAGAISSGFQAYSAYKSSTG